MKRIQLLPRLFWPRLKKIIHQQVHGGDWTDAQPEQSRHNLRWFWLDGVLSAASDNILLTYLTLYVLALGATSIQIGWMSSLSSLSATILLIPGALLVEAVGRRKRIVLISGGILSRIMILGLAIAPLIIVGPALIPVVIGLAVLRDALANLSLPAWVSLTADIVPVAWRGRYFGQRNIYMSVAGMVMILFMGEVITRLGQPQGYQWALSLALGLGMFATYSFAHIHESPITQVTKTEVGSSQQFTPKGLVRSLLASRTFLAFSICAAIWNLSLNIAGPFFNVFMVQDLFATPTTVGILGIASSLSSLPAQRVFGPLADRWGPKRIMMLTGFIIPLVPLAWVFVNASWQIVPINLVSGFLWGGYSLASFNLLLELTPQELRARTTAIFQVIVYISLAIGAALGGVLVMQFGIRSVFLVSSIGRWIAAILFARLIFFPRNKSDAESR
jgi:MFS family permease